jgi:hypothetical protein
MQFPVFLAGDVFIRTGLVKPSRWWQLDSTILTRHSSWFARSIRQPPTANRAKNKHAYVIEEVDGKVRLTHLNAEDDLPVIEKLPNIGILSRATKVSLEYTDNIDTDDNCRNKRSDSEESLIWQECHITAVEVYNQIFRTFCSIPLQLVATDVEVATSQAEHFVRVAQDLGCLHLVSSQIGNALLQH